MPLSPSPYEGNVIRNLLYHIYPTKGKGVWEWNVTQLLRRMDQFNGQRIVSVTTDSSTDSLDTVKEAFRGTVRDFLHFPNNKDLGEVVSFEPLLKRVENIDPRQITFYGHAKGVKYPVDTPHMTHRWAEVMYSNLLDYPGIVEDSLRTHPIAGTFFKSGNTFGALEKAWHYAGTFFWFRNKNIFQCPSWNRIPQAWWGTEAWPGVICPQEHADCLLMTGTAPGMQLYNRKYWNEEVNSVWHKWQLQHSSLHRHSSYKEVLDTLRSLGSFRIVVTGPQRSGTMIASQMLSNDLRLPVINEVDKTWNVDDINSFLSVARKNDRFVAQAPTMSPYVHLLPYTVVYMRRNLQDILRSSRRIGWEKYEQVERDRYFDHSNRPSAVVKHEAWDKFQRITLGERAFDLDYESMSSHPMWVDYEDRKGFDHHQTVSDNPKRKLCPPSK